MWELLFKTSEPLLKLWGFLVRGLRSPLVLEVDRFYFQDVSARPGDSILVVTPHPRRYHLEMTLTNRSGEVVYIRSIVLKCCGGKVRKEADLPNPLRLQSRELKKHHLVFPLNDNEDPRSGQFKIEIVPSVGRKSAKSVKLQ